MTPLKEADKLFSQQVRARGICQAAGFRFECSMQLQCAHIISRRYKAVRWVEENALSLCGAHHIWFTHHPLEWEDFCRRAGIDWNNLRYLALHDPPEKPADALKRLRDART